MEANKAIGLKIKQIRLEKNCTLKQLSKASGLSIGFLSQFERGMSSIALDSLEKLASILGVKLSDFFREEASQDPADPVAHGANLQPDEISPQIYQYFLGNRTEGFDLLPRVYLLMPFPDRKPSPELYAHEGEEFIFVLEGVVTVYLEDKQYTLYPGDSIQIDSRKKHNWMNQTNKTAKILTVNTPNPMKQISKPGSENLPL